MNVEDQFGNIVTTDNSTVTLAAGGPGSATGTLSASAVDGMATFNDLVMNAAGTYTLLAVDAGLTSATSSGFGVSSAAVAQLVFVQQPGGEGAGAVENPAIIVELQDQFGNLVTAGDSTVSLAAASGPGTASGTLSVDAIDGSATFSNVSFNVSGTYTLAATSEGVNVTSTSFSIGPAAASQLIFMREPSNVTAGVDESPAITVEVQDAFGNLVGNDGSTVMISVDSGPGSAAGTLSAAAVGGVATFGNVMLDTAGVYTFSAADGSLADGISGSFTVSPATASQVIYARQPCGVAAGVADNPSITVNVEDPFGNIITSDDSTVNLSVASGLGNAGGTISVAAVDGVAAFSDVIFDTTGTYTLLAADGSLSTSTSSTFAVTPAVATQLVYVQQPSDVTAGVAESPSIVVNVDDPFGNIVSTDGSTVTLAVGSGPGNASGTLSIAAVDGVANFQDVLLDTAGSYTLDATDGGLFSTISSNFTVSPAAAAQIAFVQQPSSGIAGIAVNPAITAEVQDQFGNLITTDTSTVTLSVAGGPGVINGTLSVAAFDGIASFDNVTLNAAGAYRLSASDGSLLPNSSTSFTVSPATAVQLLFAQQPSDVIAGVTNSPAIDLSVEDSFGNIVDTDNSMVSLSVASGPGAAVGTISVAAVDGVASFDDVVFDAAGSYTVSAADGTLNGATSSSFTVSPAAASQVVYAQQPSSVNAGITNNPIVIHIEDLFGNIVTTDNSAVNLSVASGAQGTLGTLSIAAASGIATFDDVVIHTAGVYRLSATDGSLIAATSTSFTISAAAATQVAFAQQPTSVSAGVANNPAITVSVEDQFGNVVSNDNSMVNLAVASGPGVAAGTLAIAATAGIAIFDRVMFDTAGTYVLSASDGSLSAANSASFNVAASSPWQLVFAAPPSDVLAGAVESPAIVVDVEDRFGNLVGSDASTISLAANSTTPRVYGTLSESAVDGVATFAAIQLGSAGTYSMSASDGTLLAATSPAFSVSPDPTTCFVVSSANPAVFGQTVILTASANNIVEGGEIPAGRITFMDGSADLGAVTLDSASTATFTLSFTSPGVHPITAIYSGSSNFLPSGSSTLEQAVNPDSTQISLESPSNSATFSRPLTFTATVTATVPGSENPTGTVTFEDGSNVLGTASLFDGVASFTTALLSAGLHNIAAIYGGDANFTASTTPVYSQNIVQTPSQLVITTQPAHGVAGQSLGSFQVSIEDAYGNLVTGDESAVSASTNTMLLGATTLNAINGVATLSGLGIDKVGVYQLTFSSAMLPAANGNPISIVPAAAAKLVFINQPQDAVIGQSIGAFGISVEDAFGNIVTDDNSTVSLSGPSGLAGPLLVSAQNGIAEFQNVSINSAGTTPLTASDGLLSPATSNPISISYSAAAGSRIAPIEINVRTLLPASNAKLSRLTLRIQYETGTSRRTLYLPILAKDGTAEIKGLKFLKAGICTLTISGPNGASITRQITVAAGAPARLAFISPKTVIAGRGTFEVEVLDREGNVCDSDNESMITLGLRGHAALVGTATAMVVNGVATFSGIALSRAGAASLIAKSSGLLPTVLPRIFR